VFLAGNGLPGRWQGRGRFVVLHIGVRLGDNFLATWQAWRDDPQRCAQLFFIAIEPQPPTRGELIAAHRNSPRPELAEALQRAWPPLTPNLHRLAFDSSRVQLLLVVRDVQASLPEIVAEVDAFCLDGFVTTIAPFTWNERLCKALGRLAAPGALLTATGTEPTLRAHLATAGFAVAADHEESAEMLWANFAPGFTPRRAPSRHRASAAAEPHALVVGGGLAGCAAAWALADQGWRSTVLERHARIASEASGNPAGLFHGIVNAQDGVHARFNRAAALEAHAAVKFALDEHAVAGEAQGLLRLEGSLTLAQMRSLLHGLGLTPDYVQALPVEAASARSGIGLHSPAWFYPGGGWVHPAGLARSFLDRAGRRVTTRHGIEAHALQRTDSGWCVLDAQGHPIAEGSTVVLANAGDALRLLGGPGWPIDVVRGQISLMDAPASAIALPRLPIAGSGYLLPEVSGQAIFGATAQAGDLDPAVRLADHLTNLCQLERLLGHGLAVNPAALQGRTAWRFSSYDRLPVIGAVPDEHALVKATRLDQPRFVPRLPGLFVFTALGSRGITWSALGAQVLASTITGAPVPLEASLLDAIDPARFISRRVRRGASA
jgi:tRNA 5-methylaminomethyl-2-thiouridine biosynthesis bifunctional protein